MSDDPVVSRDPTDVIDPKTGEVRVLRRRCSTCVFRPGNLMHLDAGRLEKLVEHHLDTGSLLTCHATLPYGDHPDFGPAVCAGFWVRHGMKTTCGWLAKHVLGLVRPMPPGDGAR